MSAFNKNHFTPRGLLQWCYIFEPDEGVQFSDGKYKLTLRLFGDDAQNLIKMMKSFDSEACEKLSTDTIQTYPYKPAKDKDKNIIPNAFDFTFKTKNKPQVVDALKNRLTKDKIPSYKNGAPLGEGILAFKPHAYQTPATGPGIGAYLQAVQIVELNQGGVNLNDFDDYEDGFVAEETTTPPMTEGQEDDLPEFAS